MSEKKTNFQNSALLKISVNFKEITCIRIRIHFFQCGSRIRIKIKCILCTLRAIDKNKVLRTFNAVYAK